MEPTGAISPTPVISQQGEDGNTSSSNVSLALRLSKTGPCLDTNDSNNSPKASTLPSSRQMLLNLPTVVPGIQTQQLKEEVIKRSKLEQYRLVCSQILPHLFVAGEDVASDRNALRQNGITHVINCAGLTCDNSFTDEFQYLKLNLYDSREEDVAWFVYDVIDFIEAARQSRGGEGKALLHCVQGVSRSCAFAIAYLMWYTRSDYNTAFTQVKQCRPIASPNSGFICNLLEFQNYLALQPAPYPFLFRMATHGEHDAQRLVPKPCRLNNSRTLLEAHKLHLDSRGCFVLQAPAGERGVPRLFVWRGRAANDESFRAAVAFVEKVQRLEGWGEEVRVVKDGETFDAEFTAVLEGGGTITAMTASGEPVPSGGGAALSSTGQGGTEGMVVPARFTDLAGLQCSQAIPDEFQDARLSPNRNRNGPPSGRSGSSKQLLLTPLAQLSDSAPAKLEARASLSNLHSDGIKQRPVLYRAERGAPDVASVDEELGWTWEKIGVYDADDLSSDDLFFLHVPGGVCHVWVGEDFRPPKVVDEDKSREDKEERSSEAGTGADGESRQQLSWARRTDFLSSLALRFGVDLGHIQVQGEGVESEAFWSAFEEGY